LIQIVFGKRLLTLSEAKQPWIDPMNGQNANLARQIIALNQKRDARFGQHLFPDSGWEVMLAMHVADRPVRSDLLAQWVKMPDRILSRWLELLTKEGLATRSTFEPGLDCYELSPAGRADLDAVLHEVRLEQAA